MKRTKIFKMPQKGQTNNPNGRPKGKPNKSTENLRSFIELFIEQNTNNLQAEFDKMEGPEKFKVIEKLLPYVLPKMRPETPEPQNGTIVPPCIIRVTTKE